MLSAAEAWEYGSRETHEQEAREGKEPVFIPICLNWVNFCNYNRKTVVNLELSESSRKRELRAGTRGKCQLSDSNASDV